VCSNEIECKSALVRGLAGKMSSEDLVKFLGSERDRSAPGRPAGRCPDDNVWAQLAEGLILPSERDDLVRHIADCSTCRRRASQVLAESDAADLSLPPSELLRRVEPRLFRFGPAVYAMAAVLVVAVGAGLYWRATSGRLDWGVDASRFVLAEADLTALGVDLAQRSIRADLEPRIDESTYRSAIAKLRPDLEAAEPSPSALALAARAGLSARFADDAAVYAQKWVDQRPTDPAAFNALGMARYLQGHFDEALDAFGTAATMRPEWVEVHLNAALAADQADRIDAAIGHLGRVIELAPNHPQIDAMKRWLGQLKALQGGGR